MTGKITEMTENTTPVGTDLLELVDDPGGTPASQKMTLTTLAGFIGSGVCNVFFHPYNNEPPATAYATLDLRNVHPVLDFDADTDESAVFTGILPSNYGGGGLTVYIHWMATSDTNAAHKCRWDAAFERMAANDLDLDADSFAAVQSATANPNATSGKITVTTIAFTAGAQMDSVAAGEAFRLKVTRDANHVSDDDMTGDAEILMIEVRETA